jgi:hypothetical protein
MDELFVFFGMCFLGAFCVIGIIEWIKSVRDAIIAAINKTGKISTIAWPIISMGLSVGMGVALGRMPMSTIFGATYNAVIFSSMLMLAFNEILGYNVIVKFLYALIDKFVYGVSSRAIPEPIVEKAKEVAKAVKEKLPVDKNADNVATVEPAATNTEPAEKSADAAISAAPDTTTATTAGA